jgi:hypothetical protein
MNREEIINQYRAFFCNGNAVLGDKDQKIIEWVEQLCKDNISKNNRFQMPSEDQLILVATSFCSGRLRLQQIVDIAAACQFIIYRLYESGDILEPTLREIESNN